MSDLDDLLVRVQRAGQAASGSRSYVVELWMAGGRRLNTSVEVQLGAYSEPQSSDPRMIASSGLDLFNRIFSGRLASAFQQAWSAAGARGRTLRLRLALDPQAPELHAVPWELMHFDDSGGMSPPRALAAEPRIAFSRYIESSDFDEGQPVTHRPVRMLLALSSPSDLQERWDLAPFDKVAERLDMLTRFSPIIESGQFHCDALEVTSEAALHSALLLGGLKGEERRGYDVLLYYGHALHHPEGGSRLVLEDGTTGRVSLYDGDELIGFVRRLPATHRPAMIALVACNSASVAGDYSLNSLAARLVIESGVSAVLAMQRLVEISLARAFTFHLSEQLLRDGRIDTAVGAARRRVFQPDDLGWSTPVLYMRNEQGQLFTPNPQLEYVEAVLREQRFVRWSGPEFINIGVLTIAPGQDWNLLRYRPEDAPAATSALQAFGQALGQPGDRGADPPEPPSNLVALIGPPHSGQSTVLQRLTYDLARAVTRAPDRPPGIFINLAGYEQQRGSNRLERHIIEQARQTTPSLGDALAELFRPASSLRADLAQPRYIFLLDGLDSAPGPARRDAARELAELARRLPAQRFVISAAQDSYPANLLPRAQVLVIQPLSEGQIFDFIQQRDEGRALQIIRQIRENRLMPLASDPSLLAMIYDRLASDPEARITRNQLVQESLDAALGEVGARFSVGEAARESLCALAWYARWGHHEQIAVADLFRVLAQVRRDRDYSLEELYGLLVEARLLIGVGQQTVRFVNPALAAYCAAVALVESPEFAARLGDIIIACANPSRLAWWEDVIYAVAGLMADAVPLFRGLAAAVRAGNTTLALIVARCLGAISPEQEAQIPPALRAELLDACVLRLREEREPVPERREQIVTALGRLTYHQIINDLRRLLVEKVRRSSSGPRYEYTNVRIAAARALRNISLATPARAPRPQAASGASDLLLTSHGDEASLAGRPDPGTMPMPSLEEIHQNQMLLRLMRIWRKGVAGRAEFRDLLRNSPSTPERAIAAFALGDLVDASSQKLLDAKHLLRVILSPGDDETVEISEDWQDTMWAAADALTLFDPRMILPLLRVLITREKGIPDSAAQQLAYLAGRIRANDGEVVAWLIRLLINNPSQSVKAKALQSLAWIGLSAAPQPARGPAAPGSLIVGARLELADGRDGPTLKQLIEDIAAWRRLRDLRAGSFTVKLWASDDGSPLYLRRKAVEALAWIGDAATLESLGRDFLGWPMELREHWYAAAATIERRLGGAG